MDATVSAASARRLDADGVGCQAVALSAASTRAGWPRQHLRRVDEFAGIELLARQVDGDRSAPAQARRTARSMSCRLVGGGTSAT
jgi:hypothetical protein